MCTGRYNPHSHSHKRNLYSRSIGGGSVHKSLLAIHEVVMGLYLLVKPFLKAGFHRLCFGFIANNNEVIAACMTNEIGCSTDLIHHFTDQHGSEAQYIIAGHETIDILERLKVVDPRIEQSPAL